MLNLSGETVWLTVSEAAKVQGVTQQAIRKKLARGSINSRRNNRGVVVVEVAQPPSEEVTTHTEKVEQPIEQQGENRIAQPSSLISLDDVGKLLGEQADRFERQQAAMREAHHAELARVDTRHSAELTRLERAYRAASDDLMRRVSAVLVANRERAPWWRFW